MNNHNSNNTIRISASKNKNESSSSFPEKGPTVKAGNKYNVALDRANNQYIYGWMLQFYVPNSRSSWLPSNQIPERLVLPIFFCSLVFDSTILTGVPTVWHVVGGASARCDWYRYHYYVWCHCSRFDFCCNPIVSDALFPACFYQ